MGDQPRLFPWPMQPSIGPTLDRGAILDEVRAGLRNERSRLADAQENANMADLQGKLYIERREAETEFDYAGRVKQVTGLTHQVVNRLCEHTYNPGPLRTVIGDTAAEQVLAAVYEANHIDAVMHEAERLACINDVAVIQVTVPADPAARQRKPVDLQLWGSEEFAVFLDPEDQRRLYAVVTIDQYDEQTRYRLWFDDVVHTLVVRKAGGARGSSAESHLIAEEIAGSPEANPYGVLPFASLGYRAPVRQFWCHGPGTFVREAEKVLNGQISELAEMIQKYCKPIGLFVDVGPEFNPEIGPSRFLRLQRGGSAYTGDGFAAAAAPDAKYLQAQLQIEGIWEHIRDTMGQVAEAVGLPPSALRLDYTDAPSGISIVARSFPLITRARQRRPIYQWAETELARTICAVYGAYYDQPALVESSKALRVVLAWPEPRIPIPGPERDESDQWELGIGIKSRLQVLMERYGLTREQALARLKEVADDEREATAILPQPEPPAAPPGGRDDEPPTDEEPQRDEG